MESLPRNGRRACNPEPQAEKPECVQVLYVSPPCIIRKYSTQRKCGRRVQEARRKSFWPDSIYPTGMHSSIKRHYYPRRSAFRSQSWPYLARFLKRLVSSNMFRVLHVSACRAFQVAMVLRFVPGCRWMHHIRKTHIFVRPMWDSYRGQGLMIMMSG